VHKRSGSMSATAELLITFAFITRRASLLLPFSHFRILYLPTLLAAGQLPRPLATVNNSRIVCTSLTHAPHSRRKTNIGLQVR